MNGGGRPKIVVIDDSEIVLEATKMALEGAGYDVVTQDRATGSAAPILHEQPAMVLVDVNMPGLAGDTLVKVLMKARIQSETIVLLHSSLTSEVLAAKAQDAGAHGFIRKSGDVFTLVREVNRWLNRTSSGKMRAARPISGDEQRPSGTRLQAASVSAAPGSGRSDPRSSGTLRTASATVLFVDDDMTLLSSYRRRFQDKDFKIEFALSGTQALRHMLSETPPDVVVCDMVLPDISGPEVYRRATAAVPRYRQGFIVATGARQHSEVSDFLAGFDGPVLCKPIDPEELLQALDTCLLATRRAIAGR